MATATNLQAEAAPGTRRRGGSARAQPAVGPGLRKTGRDRTKASAPLTGLLWLIVAIYALPLLWFLLSSFKPGSELFSYPLSLILPGVDPSRASSTPGSGWTLPSTS